MNRRRTRLVTAAALALLVAGLPVDAAARRKKKSRVKAAVNGKVIKFNRNVSITGGGDTIAFFVIAQTRPRFGGILRTISIACGMFPPAAVPGEGAFCANNYSETRIGRNPTVKGWLNSPGQTQVTFDSYDGDLITGRFSADLTSLAGDPPIRVEGEFRGRVAPAQ
jgi:hypothetical protein